MIRDVRGHRRTGPQRPVNPNEIIREIVQGHGCRMIFDFFAEAVGGAGEAPKLHPNGQISPFHMRGRNVVRVRVPDTGVV